MTQAPAREVLFAAVHPPGRAPSQRFRYEQYVEFLAEHGFRTTFAPVLKADDYGVLYGTGGYLRKGLIAGRGLARRLAEARRLPHFDIVFIQREALQLGTSWFEALAARGRPRLVFDFDDAIWLQNVSNANRNLAWLKRPSKTSKLISMADLVIAGNAYLADYARPINPNVSIVPTTIDTDDYVRDTTVTEAPGVCIGWSGSLTTIQHFSLILPVFRRLQERYGERVRFKLIGDGNYCDDALGIRGQAWNASTEVRDLSEFDIGVMPLPDDDWARGKCGLKGLQYMALEIPTVMSPVGVNTEIIDDGVNGFLADGEDEWVDKISRLIESESLRRELGSASRKTVESRYSVRSQRDQYLNLLEGLVSGNSS
jgi:glycosyltransferase involved in cell wall biosynthesis